MRISTRLKLAALVPALMALVIGLALLFSYRAVDATHEKGLAAQQIITDVDDLNDLARSYLLHHEARPREQFVLAHRALMARIDSLRLQNREQQQLLQSVRRESEGMAASFSKFIAEQRSSRAAGAGAVVREAEERLESQVLIRSRAAVSDALRLQGLIGDEIIATQKTVGGVVLLLIVVTTLGLTVMLLRTTGTVRASLAALRTGTDTIASGNLDHRIGLVVPDELGDLARAFDHMTGRLQATTVSRDVLSDELEERRRAEEALRESEGLLRAVVDGVPDPVYIKDRESRILMANPALAQVVGRPLEEIVGRTDTEYYDDAEAGQILREHDVQVMASGESMIVEETVPTPSGARTFLSTKAPRRDLHARVVGIIGVSHDITERKRADEEVLAAERARAELAETLNREIAHRTKNNLAMAAGLIQLQAMQQRDPEVSSALSETLSRLMTFASIQEQMQATASGSVDVLPVLHRIASASSGAFAGGEAVVSVTGESVTLPSKAATNLAIVVNELITNAIKYGAPGPDGKLHVEVRVAPEDDSLRLWVWNSGNPVPEDFDSGARQGMGLRLVGDLASQYSGTFALRPEAGGTTAEVVASLAELQKE